MPTPAAGLHRLRAADATTPSVPPGEPPAGSAATSYAIIPFRDHLTNYLTVIYHGDIGFPFPSAYLRITRFPGTEKRVVPLADNPRSDDAEKVS